MCIFKVFSPIGALQMRWNSLIKPSQKAGWIGVFAISLSYSGRAQNINRINPDMQINFPVRYARKNNREKSEPKLHINFRSSLSRCQSGRVNKKTLRERETGRGWLGTLRRPTGGTDLCIKIYATPSGRHHTQSPDYFHPPPPYFAQLTLVMLSEVCERAVRKQK